MLRRWGPIAESSSVELRGLLCVTAWFGGCFFVGFLGQSSCVQETFRCGTNRHGLGGHIDGRWMVGLVGLGGLFQLGDSIILWSLFCQSIGFFSVCLLVLFHETRTSVTLQNGLQYEPSPKTHWAYWEGWNPFDILMAKNKDQIPSCSFNGDAKSWKRTYSCSGVNRSDTTVLLWLMFRTYLNSYGSLSAFLHLSARLFGRASSSFVGNAVFW